MVSYNLVYGQLAPMETHYGRGHGGEKLLSSWCLGSRAEQGQTGMGQKPDIELQIMPL